MTALIIKASLIIGVFWLFYKLMLERESFFQWNRIYLLSGLLCSFLLPYVPLPELISHQGVVSSVLQDVGVDAGQSFYEAASLERSGSIDSAVEVAKASNVQKNGNAIESRGLLFWVSLIYVFGALVLFFRFVGQLFTLLRKIRAEKDPVIDGTTIIINGEGASGPCSFFNYIFIDPVKYEPAVYEQVLEHEKVHVRKWHSLDLLIAELVIIILWFNPFAWYYRKEVEKNIEYQTDDFLLRSQMVPRENYQINLLEIATQQKPLALVSSYNQSLIKKRIVMMNTKKSNRNNYFKYAFMAPVVLVTLLFVNRPFSLGAQESQNSYPYDAEYKWAGNGYRDGNSQDRTPLMMAATDGDMKMVKNLIADGADVNELLHGEGTALYMALEHSHMEIAKLLLEKGADPNLGSQADGYPIMAAIASGDEDIVRLLITQGADVNKSFPGDGNAMIQAAKSGFLGSMKMLVEAGADLDKGVRGDGNPLIMAAKAGHLQIVNYLVTSGANINAEVVDDETPLINASEQGHFPVVKYLVENGANVNQSSIDSSGRYRSPLQMATEKGHAKIAKYLQGKGAKE